jgi:phytoene dehydrogenase-like protein
MDSYAVVVIGGGHNGLVCAAYLAKAGRKVLALERRAIVGGAAVTEEFFPGFKFSACADGVGRLWPNVVRDLNLQASNLALLHADPVLFAPQPDGSRLFIWRDAQRTAREIERFSKKDADRYPAFVAKIERIAGLLTAFMQMTPPDVAQPDRGDVMELLKLAGPARILDKRDRGDMLRYLPMPVSDLLDEWFESGALKAALAATGVQGMVYGPKQAGTGYVFLTSVSGGHFFSAGTIKGGMGALSEAIANAARSFGAEIRTGAEVAQVRVTDGRATGVILADGEEISARVVISNADPRTTFLKLIDSQQIDSTFLMQLRNIKYRGATARVHLALSALPTLTALKGDDPSCLRGLIRIAPGVNYLERASDAAKYGEFSPQPYLDVTIPSLADTDLAPPGRHAMSITAQYAPYRLKQSNWEDQREVFGDVVIDTLAQYAPDIREKIVHRRVLTPLDLETIYGLPEGSGSHGEMTLDQFLYMRPVPGYAQYRTPIRGLYLCGAGTHPGGGVTGINGSNAAREVLKDWRRM